MDEQEIETRSYVKLLLLAALLGAASAAVLYTFMWLVDTGSAVVWQTAAGATGLPAPIFTFLVCTFGGLLVGIVVKVFGDHSGIFAELMVEFGRTGRFDYRHAPGIVVTSLISLISGGSLGPEAPMADACGGMGTWLADRLKLDARQSRVLGFAGLSGMLAAFITSPFAGAVLALESAKAAIAYVWTIFPSLVASAVATTVFLGLTNELFGALYTFPTYQARVTDLLLAVPLGLVGALAGVVFMLAFQWLRKLMAPLQRHLILRGLIGGVGLGLAGAWMPLVLFSGEQQTQTLIESAASIGVLPLIGLALVKLLVTSLLLATGWKGGYIFPTMFASVALGLATSLIFPAISPAVAVAATMGGVMVATLKAPLFSALFVAVLVQRETAPVIAIAVIVSVLATTKFSMTPALAPATEK
jgi:H+/Cl- antiporter ClcA